MSLCKHCNNKTLLTLMSIYGCETMKDLAAILDMAPQHLSKINSGKSGTPKWMRLLIDAWEET